MIFRERSDGFEAVQYTGNNAEEIEKLLGQKLYKVIRESRFPTATTTCLYDLYMVSRSVLVKIPVGYWVFKGEDNEGETIGSPAFEAMYEQVKDGE